jgi:DHA2 family multidrug resistance protein
MRAIEGLRHAGFDTAHAIGAMTNQFISQAYLLATLDFFRISAWLMFLLAPAVWLTRKAVGGGGHAAAD